MSFKKTGTIILDGIRTKLRRQSSTGSKNDSNYKDLLSKMKIDFENNWRIIHKHDTNVNFLEDFTNLKTVGTGSFGIVYFAREKSSNEIHAIKVLSKKKVMKTNQLEHTNSEMKILKSIEFPFVIHLEQTFTDNSNLYLKMEMSNGGEIFRLLRSERQISECWALFYAAQIVLVFEYLHNVNIIYRDLKPENVLLDNQGYIKMVDFGFSKRTRNITYTLCGTPDYLAPEMILCRGYGKGVDWWAFGIILYEMVAGYTPFYSDQPMTCYEKIVVGKVSYPKHFSKELIDLIKHLLKVDASSRYGCLKNGTNDVKYHSWFNSTDWLSIFYKKIEAPFIPSVLSDEDTTNFDNYIEEDIETSNVCLFADEFQEF